MRIEPNTTETDVSVSFPHRAALQERQHLINSEESAHLDLSHMAQSRRRSNSSPEDEQADEVDQVANEERSFGRKNDLEVELATKQREVSHLVDEMERLQSSINNLKEISTTKISQLEDMVNEKDRIIKDLAEKLLRQQDYSDLKRELRLLKTLETGGWQPWCPSEQAETASPAVDIKMDLVNTQRDPSPVTESASPCSGTHEDVGSVPATPPSESSSLPRSPSSSAEGISSPSSVQRLHRCLRNNVDRFAGESLDTLGISRCVRELLSAHNIGQRMFAKLVLGLSQGTVSELLSKPKPWDKLTEKGRDSYRKMHAWACDQQCVHLLKSLLPRKGRETSVIKMEPPHMEERASQGPASDSEPFTPTSGNGDIGPQPSSESKNNNIIEDGAMEEYGKTPTSSDYDTPHRSHNFHDHFRMGHSPFHHGGMLPHGKPPMSCGDFPPIVLAHLYQEELLKLIGKRLKEGCADDHAKQAQEDVRQALSIYHRELALLAQQGALGRTSRMSSNPSSLAPSPSCHSCSSGRRPNCSIPYCPTEHQQQPCCRSDRAAAGPYSVISPYSGTSPLVPLPSEAAQAPGTEAETSPLQRMQSITNSLLSQSSAPNFATLPQRPSKAVLPPITQQQFDQYNNLNTEDIVKRVKEQLSQYSISQRLFGENVLGLSQGSVSDLLARPKPWHMLTQKGREPFIRMKMFLEDESAVHKLVASQYKIAPERLMRIGGYGPPTSTAMTPHAPSRFGSLSADTLYGGQLLRAPLEGQQPPSKGEQPHSMIPSSSPKAPSTPETREAAPPAARGPSGPCAALQPTTTAPKPVAQSRRGAGHHARCLPCAQPSVYEMAAVTTDLDTHFVTARIKETLTVHNIGQKLFGEAVLGLSQGSVSELLSKPKPWHMLSIKGREPFIRMQLWLNDPTNVEKLQAIKSERREANKRRRSSMEPDIHHPSNHADKSTPLPSYPLDLPPVFLYPPAKKPRILFSEEQKEALRLAYTLDSYPSTAVMEFLSNELGLSVRTITNWFHNHRMRLKQQQPDGSMEPDGSGFNRPPGAEPSSFDPIRFRMLLGQRLAEMCSQQTVPSSELAMLPYLAEPLRLCPPPTYQSPDPQRSTDATKSESDTDTLDLSMSSQKFPQRSKDSLDARDVESVHSTTSGENEDNKLKAMHAISDKESVSSPRTTSYDIRESLCNMVTSTGGGGSNNHSNSNSGSNRRKAAAPQWVNPGLDLSPDSDLCSFDDDDDLADYDDLPSWKNDTNISSGKQIINGVCVRQTDIVSLEEQRKQIAEVVHVVPAPASEDAMKAERQKNIQRIERAIVEQEDDWDFTESEGEDDNSDTYQSMIQQR